jgi:hypothetical protein
VGALEGSRQTMTPCISAVVFNFKGGIWRVLPTSINEIGGVMVGFDRSKMETSQI